MPEGKFRWCAFCGLRMKYFVIIKRDNGSYWRVGRTCLGRVGLELPNPVKEFKVTEGGKIDWESGTLRWRGDKKMEAKKEEKKTDIIKEEVTDDDIASLFDDII